MNGPPDLWQGHSPPFLVCFSGARKLLYGGFHAKSVTNLPFCVALDCHVLACADEHECQQVWSQAVPSGDALPQANAAPFIVNFKQADGNQDGAISQAEFDAACAKGLVKFTQR